jgi:hypothetical protein
MLPSPVIAEVHFGEGTLRVSGQTRSWQNPCTIPESMPEKLFMVYLNGAEDPMDLAYHQPVRASRVEVSEDCLSFFAADGTLAAFFDKSAVHSWREINESELLAN